MLVYLVLILGHQWLLNYLVLILGHQWLLNYLGVRPKSSWSVDPFGHGGTFPYVLKSSGKLGCSVKQTKNNSLIKLAFFFKFGSAE